LPPVKSQTKRLRVFAGPNGSGKTTIIEGVRDYRIKGIPIDFGIYINADDIARNLRLGKFDFAEYRIKPTSEKFIAITNQSGLIGKEFSERKFISSFKLAGTRLVLLNKKADERLAQIIAHFLREELLEQGLKFSFETVFSHQSKLDIMKRASERGYKVYLYFVSTESPEINIYRVSVRTDKGGHDVPDDKIRSRYQRSLELMFEAAQVAYQAYFLIIQARSPNCKNP
jgi:predicted ABC-type ATPase